MIYSGVPVLFESTHRLQPCLQPAVICLDAVVGVLLGSMPCHGQQPLQHDRVRRCSIGDDLDRGHLGRANGPLEEPVRRGGVTPHGGNTSMTRPN
jgi:hypothetical protein